MRKVLSITIMLLMTIGISAQQYLVLDRNFNTSGKATAFCDKPNINDCLDNMMLKDGYSWHLKNTVLAGENFIEFWMSNDSDGSNLNYSSWNQSVKLVMMKDDDGVVSYIIMDQDFNHLLITIDKTGNAGIHLCSVLRE